MDEMKGQSSFNFYVKHSMVMIFKDFRKWGKLAESIIIVQENVALLDRRIVKVNTGIIIIIILFIYLF